MLNLLPKKYKEQVRAEYIRRFIITSAFVLSFVTVSFGVAIFPTYLDVKLKKEAVEADLANVKSSSLAKDKNAVTGTIKDLETKIKVISLVSGERATDFISKASDLKTKGISIQNISYVKKDDSLKEVVVSGVAQGRADAVAFSKKVKSSGWIVVSDIPLSNLASERNIPFSITLTSTSTKQ